MTTHGRFQLHLPGLLKVLAEHLYSTQRVGIRELIQNSHDSCIRRSVEHPDPTYRPRIDLTIDGPAKRLRIDDNGSGLTEDEIHSYLTVIGRGYTRELRERTAIDNAEVSQELIGQFGIGFLSAYLVASEVTVETRSQNGRALRWFSAGDEQFELNEGTRTETGTTVDLLLKPSAYFLLHEQNLVDVVREYADFLPIPIHVEQSTIPANLGSKPWDDPDPQAGCRDYVKRRFGEGDPLWILPLNDGQVDLGHDTLTVPLRGFLFVPAQSVLSVKEYGAVSVYIRSMSICEREEHLLPPWARFVQGVIDCPALQPTASREAVHQDDAFESVRQIIAEQLSSGLRTLAHQQPEVWRRIVYGHSDLILGWACKDDEFFRLVADWVPLKTSRGRIALPEYLEASGNVACFTTRHLDLLQEKILAEACDVPAIDASWFAVLPFLTRYSEQHSDVKLVRLDDELDTLLRPAAAGEFQELIDLCQELGFVTRAAVFRPSDLPAIMTYPATAEVVRDATSALDEGLLPDGFSGLVQGYLEQQRSVNSDVGTLHLNAACPLIQRLASSSVPTSRKQSALAVIAYFAKLFCGRMLNAAQATTDLAAWQKSLNHLV